MMRWLPPNAPPGVPGVALAFAVTGVASAPDRARAHEGNAVGVQAAPFSAPTALPAGDAPEPDPSEAEADDADPDADAEALSDETDAEGSFEPEVSLGATWLWMQDKATPGIELGLSWEPFRLDLETSFLSLTRDSPDLDGGFLGNQLGVHAGAFYRLGPLELVGSLGVDVYLLWGIHSSVTELALAPRVTARYRIGHRLSVGLGARAYLLSSEGLELGTARDGQSGSPILLGSSIAWSFR
jgi:hypothetical protein